ncbi:glycerophosphodiester phosphodiesterase [Hanstruepera neustonica]|uniref:Glycerophosphodiester phosphodiesterase n=1 Tax=Hanstruepera neustonica TaxID=1445657 RepID=A0A2K1E4F3_9FLAO|nr:glycerophosphodiester phosphodiesterase family protein [Hanstruepera neustonica]PNQ75158.1 glycerophosphodiester phosphodiesterase [Hanstruepera neustonica]
MYKILNIGHRGAKGHIAENTIESIEKALEFQVDGIEIDVHVCASGELVVFHDFTLDRMTNGSGEVSKHTLSELQKLKVEHEYTIPTLENVLNFIDAKCLLNIELKGKDTAIKICEVIKNCIENSNWDYSDFIVSSFQHHELETVFKTNQNIPLAVLTKASVMEAMEFAKTIKAKTIHPNVALLTQENVKLAQNQGFSVNTWTINDKKTIARMKRYGVNGIISDYPDSL